MKPRSTGEVQQLTVPECQPSKDFVMVQPGIDPEILRELRATLEALSEEGRQHLQMIAEDQIAPSIDTVCEGAKIAVMRAIIHHVSMVGYFETAEFNA